MSAWNDPHCVYALLDGDTVVYVGCSCNPEQRFRLHRTTRKLKANIAMRVIRWYADIVRASRYEKFYIQKFKPAWNKRSVRLPASKARAIWFSRERRGDEYVVTLMSGWTVKSAKFELGSRRSYFCDRRRKRRAA